MARRRLLKAKRGGQAAKNLLGKNNFFRDIKYHVLFFCPSVYRRRCRNVTTVIDHKCDVTSEQSSTRAAAAAHASVSQSTKIRHHSHCLADYTIIIK